MIEFLVNLSEPVKIGLVLVLLSILCAFIIELFVDTRKNILDEKINFSGRSLADLLANFIERLNFKAPPEEILDITKISSIYSLELVESVESIYEYWLGSLNAKSRLIFNLSVFFRDIAYLITILSISGIIFGLGYQSSNIILYSSLGYLSGHIFMAISILLGLILLRRFFIDTYGILYKYSDEKHIIYSYLFWTKEAHKLNLVLKILVQTFNFLNPITYFLRKENSN